MFETYQLQILYPFGLTENYTIEVPFSTQSSSSSKMVASCSRLTICCLLDGLGPSSGGIRIFSLSDGSSGNGIAYVCGISLWRLDIFVIDILYKC